MRIKIGRGCNERNVWGKIERGPKLCKDCGATYDSHCVCHATKKPKTIMVVKK